MKLQVATMEDKRIAWMKECVYAGLDLSGDQLFTSLLTKNNNQVSEELSTFLDQPSDKYSPATIFYRIEHEVEEMVEVIEGMELVRGGGLT